MALNPRPKALKGKLLAAYNMLSLAFMPLAHKDLSCVKLLHHSSAIVILK